MFKNNNLLVETNNLYDEESPDQFSRRFVEKFKTKTKKVEEFFNEIKKDLIEDFELLKHLVEDCEDIENFRNENVIKNLTSIKHDYEWRQNVQGDELSCRLAFIHLYKLINHLKQFIVINKIAIMHIKEKFVKCSRLYPEIDPEAKFLDEIEDHIKEFDEILLGDKEIQNEIVKFYAEQFFSADQKLARKELEKKYEDSDLLNFLILAEIVVFVFLLIGYFIMTFLTEYKNSIWEIHVYFPAFSFSLMIIMFLLYIPVLLIILKKYKINYIYLLELDPEVIYPPEKLMRHFLVLLIIWVILLIGYRLSLSYYPVEFEGKHFIFPVIVLCLLFTYAFWPFRCMFSKLRVCVLITVIKCFLPITKCGVKFKDFLFADIFTSYAIALANLTVAFCLFYCPECRVHHSQAECHKNYAIPVFLIIPALIRIMQCANLVYYNQKRNIELINLVKYTIHAVDLVVGYLYLTKIVTKEIYIIVVSLSTVYLFTFDNMIDWNLWHLKSKNFLLRDILTYPKFFYYFAMVINAGLRFFWFFSLVFPMTRDWSLLIANTLEIYRRAQWFLIRLENEQLYNLEGYRKYLPVPEMPLH